MKRAIGLALVIVVLSASSALAGVWKIRKIAYDPPGTDGTKYNQEFVVIKNTGGQAKNLKGYKVRDKGADHTYTFPKTIVGAGDTVKLHTGSGNNGSGHRYWKLDNFVWNNDGDKATLIRPNGTTADSCSYSDGDGTANC